MSLLRVSHTQNAFVGIVTKYLIPSLLSGLFEIWLAELLTNVLQTFGIRSRSGEPQGCLLSPLLFTLHTHSCSSVHEENSTVESNNSKNLYPKEISCVTEWCWTDAAHHQQHQANWASLLWDSCCALFLSFLKSYWFSSNIVRIKSLFWVFEYIKMACLLFGDLFLTMKNLFL